jgi:hypothetical protein
MSTPPPVNAVPSATPSAAPASPGFFASLFGTKKPAPPATATVGGRRRSMRMRSHKRSHKRSSMRSHKRSTGRKRSRGKNMKKSGSRKSRK